MRERIVGGNTVAGARQLEFLIQLYNNQVYDLGQVIGSLELVS